MGYSAKRGDGGGVVSFSGSDSDPDSDADSSSFGSSASSASSASSISTASSASSSGERSERRRSCETAYDDDDGQKGRERNTGPPRPPMRLRGYRLGDAARNAGDMQIPADALQLHDFTFVKLSDGTWTYAILAERFFRNPDNYEERRMERESDTDEEYMIFVIGSSGRTKQLRRDEWKDFVSLVDNSPNMNDAKASCTKPSKRDTVKAALNVSMRIEEKQLKKQLKKDKEKEKMKKELKAKSKENKYEEEDRHMEMSTSSPTNSNEGKTHAQKVGGQDTVKAAINASMKHMEKDKKMKKELQAKTRLKFLELKNEKKQKRVQLKVEKKQKRRQGEQDLERGQEKEKDKEREKEKERLALERQVEAIAAEVARQRRLKEKERELQRQQFREQFHNRLEKKREATLNCEPTVEYVPPYSGADGSLLRRSNNGTPPPTSTATSAGFKLLGRNTSDEFAPSRGAAPSGGLSSGNRLASAQTLGMYNHNNNSGRVTSSKVMASRSIGDLRKRMQDRPANTKSGRTKDNINWGYL